MEMSCMVQLGPLSGTLGAQPWACQGGNEKHQTGHLLGPWAAPTLMLCGPCDPEQERSQSCDSNRGLQNALV